LPDCGNTSLAQLLGDAEAFSVQRCLLLLPALRAIQHVLDQKVAVESLTKVLNIL